MTPSVPSDRGQGPVVVLLHGVGVGPASFARVAERLAERRRVVALERPVGPDGTALPLVEQAHQLAQLLPEVGAAGARLVGVSGGATLGLCLAIHHPGSVDGLVLHEPLVGSLAPDLHHRFQLAADRAALGEAEAVEVVRGVMGEVTWAALDPSARAAAEAQARRWQGEIAAFAAFDPTPDQLAGLAGLPVLVTVGERSGPERLAAADVLHRSLGAEVLIVPGAGNAAQLDAPDAFAELIATTQTVSTGGTA